MEAENDDGHQANSCSIIDWLRRFHYEVYKQPVSRDSVLYTDVSLICIHVRANYYTPSINQFVLLGFN